MGRAARRLIFAEELFGVLDVAEAPADLRRGQVRPVVDVERQSALLQDVRRRRRDDLLGEPLAPVRRLGDYRDLPDVRGLQLDRRPARDLPAHRPDHEDLAVEPTAQVDAASVVASERLGLALDWSEAVLVGVEHVAVQAVGVG